MEKVVEKSVLKAARVVEEQLDAEIERLDNLDDDELESLHQKRLQQARRVQYFTLQLFFTLTVNVRAL